MSAMPGPSSRATTRHAPVAVPAARCGGRSRRSRRSSRCCAPPRRSRSRSASARCWRSAAVSPGRAPSGARSRTSASARIGTTSSASQSSLDISRRPDCAAAAAPPRGRAPSLVPSSVRPSCTIEKATSGWMPTMIALRPQQLHHLRDAAQRAGGEGIHDVQHAHVDDDAGGAVPPHAGHQLVAQLCQIGVGHRALHRGDQDLALA